MDNLSIDNWVTANKIPVGVGLMVAGGWITSATIDLSALWYLNLLGIIILIGGSLYLFK